MARVPEEMAYYAIRDDAGLPRVMHSVTARPPLDGIEISEAEARAISGAYRSTAQPQADGRNADPEGLAALVLNEAREQIVAVVNEASGDRDEKFEELANRVQSLEVIIGALHEGSSNVLKGKP